MQKMKNFNYFMEAVNIDAGNNNTLEIVYFNASAHKCRFTVTLSEFLPCGAHDLNTLCSIIDISTDPAGNAATLNNYILTVVNALLKYRENAHNEKEKADFTSCIKKMIAVNAGLVKRYNVPEINDAECVRFSVCRRIFTRGTMRTSLEEHSGHKFNKYGYTFYVCKRNKLYYCYAENAAGIPLSQGATSREAAVAVITPRVIELLKSKADELAELNKQFISDLINAGYYVPDEMQETQETTERPQNAENAEKSDGTPAGVNTVPEAEKPAERTTTPATAERTTTAEKPAANTAPAETPGNAPKTAENAPTAETYAPTAETPKTAPETLTTATASDGTTERGPGCSTQGPQKSEPGKTPAGAIATALHERNARSGPGRRFYVVPGYTTSHCNISLFCGFSTRFFRTGPPHNLTKCAYKPCNVARQHGPPSVVKTAGNAPQYIKYYHNAGRAP